MHFPQSTKISCCNDDRQGLIWPSCTWEHFYCANACSCTSHAGATFLQLNKIVKNELISLVQSFPIFSIKQFASHVAWISVPFHSMEESRSAPQAEHPVLSTDHAFPSRPGECRRRVFKLRLTMCPGVLHFSAVKLPSEGKAFFLISPQLLVEAGDDHVHPLSLPSAMDGRSAQGFGHLTIKCCLSSASKWAQNIFYFFFNPLIPSLSLT